MKSAILHADAAVVVGGFYFTQGAVVQKKLLPLDSGNGG
jgi:hypothetical protein